MEQSSLEDHSFGLITHISDWILGISKTVMLIIGSTTKITHSSTDNIVLRTPKTLKGMERIVGV
jgi:hypothetical protein